MARWGAPRRSLRGRRHGVVAALAVVIVAIGANPSGGGAAAAPDDPFTLVATAEAVGDSVGAAVRAGDQTLYVVSRTGGIVAIDVVDGAAAPVVDLGDLVTSRGGEQGLLGLAFSPDGALAYVNYTAADSGATVIAELPVVVGADGAVAFERAGLRELLRIEQPYTNHNGGDLLFGPDGMLYVPTGDGGAGGDPQRYAQDLGSLLGKLVRIDPRPDTGGNAYTVPADNPYVGIDGVRPEIWAVGLRNPWRVAFDPATGDLWIADVGQNAVEEINLAPAAGGADAARDANFGWSALEGDRPYNDDVELHTGDRLDPVFTYGHGAGDCSVSGGARVRGAADPALEGAYVFADYCSARVYVLAVDGDGAEAVVSQEPAVHDGPAAPTSVTQGPDGAVYLTAADGLFRFSPTG